MKSWKATLTNGHVINSDQAGEWRRVVEHCKKDNLKISSLKYNDKEVDDRAESYFVIHSGFASLNSTTKSIRIGLGSFRHNGKCRISWFNVHGDPIYPEHTEVIPPQKAEMYKPLTIEVCREK